ncbi:MAG: hypothetical protein AB7O45_02830 [Alphaproteobacteria bacterium]
MPDLVSRRSVVTGLAAGATLIGWCRFGAAFQIEPIDARGAAALAEACGGPRDDHRRIVSDFLKDDLARPLDERLPRDRLLELIARASCPVCGCAIGPIDPASLPPA